MNVLIKESESLEGRGINQDDLYVQYAAVIKNLGTLIKLHSQ